MSMSNWSENAMLNWAFNASTMPTRPTAWYVAPHTADPGETGATAELTSSNDANFVRKSTTFGTATTGQAISAGAVSWTPTAGSFVVTHLSIWDALTGGNCLASGALSVARTVTNAAPLAIIAGDLVVSLD